MIIRFFDADTGEPPPWPTDPQFIAAGGAATIIDEGSTWDALSGTGSYASLSGYHRTTRRIGHSISKPLCVNPRFLRVDEARGVEPLALPEVAS